MKQNTRTLCEGAILIALALVLDMIRLYRLPSGGSVTLSAVPLVFFAVRHGYGYGAMAGVIFGTLNYIFGGHSIDWTTILFDYFLAFSALGFGAGLFSRKKLGCIWGSLTGISLQFLSSYLVGVFVWGKWMPEEFLGLTMTTPWLYSFLYNILWAAPDLLLTLAVFAILLQFKPMRRYLTAQDLS